MTWRINGATAVPTTEIVPMPRRRDLMIEVSPVDLRTAAHAITTLSSGTDFVNKIFYNRELRHFASPVVSVVCFIIKNSHKPKLRDNFFYVHISWSRKTQTSSNTKRKILEEEDARARS